jgi:outer membrane protein insertion porin family
MQQQVIRTFAGALALAVLMPALASAQDAAPQPSDPQAIAVTACGDKVARPAALPPAGSPPFFWIFQMCFPTQGNSPNLEVETYQYYIKLPQRISTPSQNIFRPWNEEAEEVALQDFRTLMFDTSFLDDMTIEVTDHVFENGVVGKMVAYKMEERERVKIVDYQDGDGKSISIVKRSDIDEKLRERNIEIRLDSFIDEAQVRRVKGVVRELMAEKGFTNATIDHKITPVAGGPKLVNVTFIAKQGPKIKIRKIEFVGNTAISDGTLQRKMKENKPQGLLSFITSTGTYKEAAFEEDAAKVVDHYRNNGYARARVGTPEVKVLENTDDGKTQWIQLNVPVEEGPRYRMAKLDFDGNKVIASEGLSTLYKVKPGDWFNWKRLQEGNRKAQEIYGGAGYMEFNPFPMMKYSDDPNAAEEALTNLVPDALAAPPEPSATATSQGPPTVEVTMRIDEGPQYFVNRLTFTGNTTTRDNVIRREVRLLEGNVFNTEALKYSVRRLNQLGYFRELHGDQRDTKVDKTPGKENHVDVTVRVEEQNRNQLTFGAGVSQYEGFFGQLAFQTSNFLGRGESLTLQMTAGDRSQNYQLAFTEPFLFDRNITGGFDIYKRAVQYIGYYTQKSTGGNLTFGFPVADFSRMFINYAYETVRMTDLNEALIDQSCLLRSTGCSTITSLNDLSQLTPEQRQVLQRNPFIFDSLLIGQGGKRSISKVVPTFQHNTVDNPIFPNTGRKLTAAVDLAVFGGNTHFYKPSIEGIAFFRHTSRTSVGFRGQFQYIAPIRGPTSLPIFERLFLGGEYTIRGFDIRSVGPTVPGSIVVLGGNKSLLFNAEYLFTVVNQVRIVTFFDAGQVQDFGNPFRWKEDVTTQDFPAPPPLVDPNASSQLVDPNAPGPTTRVVGETYAFKASTGVELRFFMPVLNVPFRLIYSWNPSRTGVLDNQLRPAKETTFRFAVGTTF